MHPASTAMALCQLAFQTQQEVTAGLTELVVGHDFGRRLAPLLPSVPDGFFTQFLHSLILC